MERRATLYALLVFGGLIGACFVFALVLFKSLEGIEGSEYAWSSDKSSKAPRIGVVEVSGVITESKEILARLVELRRDPKLKAIVVRVDSPGGAVAPSQEIFRAILRARKDKKVVVSMGTLAASGGYYIAAAADRIYASPGTITGSIGVISQFPDVSGLLEAARVKETTIKSGALKDVGSPTRAMTAEEKGYFQGLVDDIYDQFLSDVATQRKLPKEEVRKLADGRVLTGQQALAAKLVDELGNLEDAIEGAAKLAGANDADGAPVPVFYKKKQSMVQELLTSSAESATAAAAGAVRRELSTAASPGATIELRDPFLR